MIGTRHDPFDFEDCEICGGERKPDEFEVCRACKVKHGLEPDEDNEPRRPPRDDDWE